MSSISVVIPAYNASPWIAATLESVLDQELPAQEVIVVDDGSTDDTAAVVACFSEIRYIPKANGGPNSARNVGIRASQSEYVAFVDSDDLWLPQKLALQLEVLRNTGRHWVYCDAYSFDGETGETLHTFSKIKHLYEGDVLRHLYLGNFIGSPTPIVKRSLFEEVGYFDEAKLMPIGEDWDMWLRLAARYPIALAQQPLARYRVHRASTTGRESLSNAFESQLKVIARATAREPSRLGPLRNRAIAKVCTDVGRAMVRNGALEDARRLFVRAAVLVPYRLEAYFYWLSTFTGPTILKQLIGLRRKLLGR